MMGDGEVQESASCRLSPSSAVQCSCNLQHVLGTHKVGVLCDSGTNGLVIAEQHALCPGTPCVVSIIWRIL